jgi:hypothetical protein
MRVFTVLGSLLIVVCAQAAVAQTLCNEGESAVACLERLSQLRAAPAVTATGERSAAATQPQAEAMTAMMMDAGERQLSVVNTGTQTVDAAQQSAVKDFVTPFLAFLQSAVGGTRTGDTLTLAWNMPFGAVSETKKLNLTAAFKDPVIDSKVETALTAVSASRLDAAKAGLDALDDVVVKAAWSFTRDEMARTTRIFERPIRQNAGLIVSHLRNRARQVRDAHLAAIRENSEFATADVPAELVSMRNDFIDTMTADVMRVADAMAEAAKNQPQFWGDVGYHHRDPAIGASELTVSLNYEKPMKKTGTAIARELTTPGQRVMTFLTGNAKSDKETNEEMMKPRLKFTAAYNQVRSRAMKDVTIADYLPSKSSHVLAATLGGQWDVATVSKQRNGLFDLNATFENNSAEAAKHNRLIATGTFTQRVSDKIQIPIEFVYASKKSDLPSDLNGRFSTHFGVKYQLPDKFDTGLVRQLIAQIVANPSQLPLE